MGEYDDCGENEYKYLSFLCVCGTIKNEDKVAKLKLIINDAEKQSVVAQFSLSFGLSWSV